MAPKSISRLEANKEVRRVLVRHGIDTTKVHFSVAGRALLLTGALFRDGGHDVETKVIDTVMQELGRIGVSVTCELDNWIISDGTITKKGVATAEAAKKAAAPKVVAAKAAA